MQNRQKAVNLLGLAMRAGKVVTGTETVIADLKKTKVKLVVLASDLQKNTIEKVSRAANKNNVPMISEFTAVELENAVGKKRKVLGLTDSGFCKALVKKINEGV